MKWIAGSLLTLMLLASPVRGADAYPACYVSEGSDGIYQVDCLDRPESEPYEWLAYNTADIEQGMTTLYGDAPVRIVRQKGA